MNQTLRHGEGYTKKIGAFPEGTRREEGYRADVAVALFSAALNA